MKLRSVHVFIQAKLPFSHFQSFLTLLNGYFFAVYKICNFILKRNFRAKINCFEYFCGNFLCSKCRLLYCLKFLFLMLSEVIIIVIVLMFLSVNMFLALLAVAFGSG